MIEASVVGITFCKVSQETWDELKTDTELTLEREPDNPRDKNAIKVLHKDKLLGYIERDVAVAIDEGVEVTCKLMGKRGTPENHPILAVALYVRWSSG